MTGIALTVETDLVDPDSAPSGEPSRLVFSHQPLWVGRSHDAEVCLPDARVSLRHLEVRREAQDWFAVDLGSTNGSWLNDRRMTPNVPRLVRGGDVLTVGPFRLALETDVPVDANTLSTTAMVGGRLVREILGRLQPGPISPRLHVVAGLDVGRAVSLDALGAQVLIGRAEHCELRLVDGLASREHARVRRDLGGLVAIDLGGRNVTLVNREPLRGERRLRDRDELRVGDTCIVVSDPADALVASLEPVADEAWELRGSALVRAVYVPEAASEDAPSSTPMVDAPGERAHAAPADAAGASPALGIVAAEPLASEPVAPEPVACRAAATAERPYPWGTVLVVGVGCATALAAYLLYALLGG